MSAKRLGRGIGALISSETEPQPKPAKPGVAKILLKSIKPNPYQPRRNFDETALEELMASIKLKGIITPITVREAGEGYELVAGERRWRASKKVRLRTIPAYVIDVKGEAEMMQVALIENIQREDLNPMEEAEAYAVLNSKYNLSHDAIAKSVGKKRVTVSNALRLLKLPPEIRKSIRKGNISGGHGRAILQAKTIAAMKNLWRVILKKDLSVRAAEALVKPKSKETKIKKIIQSTAPIRAIENQLIELLGTKVKLKPGQEGGSIEIIYFSDDDLERILDLLQSL